MKANWYNRRLDYLHKISYQLINENQVIIAENLAINNMVKNHCLAKSILDAAFGELFRQLDYKSEWYGRTFYQINTFYPSSKTCNGCQHVLDKLPLSIREWTCPNCSKLNDIDLNAAYNIRDEGLRNLAKVSGCGSQSDVKQKHVEASSGEESMKHEAPAFRRE